jgi:hypothetical protein
MLGEIVKPENSNCSGFLRVHAEEDVKVAPRLNASE